MTKQNCRYLLAILISTWLLNNTWAQNTSLQKAPCSTLSTLDDIIDKEVMLSTTASDGLFAPLLTEQDETTYRAYYQTISALRNNNKRATEHITHFSQQYPAYSRTPELWLLWGDYQWRKRKYKQALQIYEEVDTHSLNAVQKAEFGFKIAYTYFKLKNYDRALPLFKQLSQSDSDKQVYATYYYAYLQFEKKDFISSLQAFESIETHPKFKGIVPYYKAQIYNEQEKYHALISQERALQAASNKQLRPRLRGLIGTAYFETKDYAQALALLEQDKSLQQSPYSNYRIAYAAIQCEQTNKAIQYLEKIPSTATDIYQNALILLGNSYLKIGNKDFAAKAFYTAFQQDEDPKLKEDALFNFAKLSYELNNDPYQRAIHALNDYIQQNPNSTRLSEANTYLVNLFLSSKNYKAAYALLKAMPNKGSKLQKAYQKIAFNRGVELYNAASYTEATDAFKQSAEQNVDKLLSAKALYWQASAYYAEKDYWEAITYWQSALKLFQRHRYAPPARIYYNIGFGYYQLKRYTKAIKWFQQSSTLKQLPPNLKADSYLRMADAYFVSKDFDQAIAAYQQAKFTDVTQSDYANYQIALAEGGKGNFSAKTNTLESFGQNFRTSALADDALFELGTTYLILNKNNEAINSFNRLSAEHPKSPFKKQAMLKAGLCYYNTDYNPKALEVLKQVVTQYQGSKEAKEALNCIQNIYIESDKAGDFISYAHTLPNTHITTDKQDSITYMAAEHAYMEQNNLPKAISDFTKYIDLYPQGHFKLYAHFYRAECLMREEAYDNAKQDYSYVLTNSSYDFIETSLAQMGRISAHQQEWNKSLRFFQRLFAHSGSEHYLIESLDGQMEAFKQLKKHDSLLVIGQTILSRSQAPTATIQKAHAYMANAALQLNKLDLAEKEYSIVGKIAQGEVAVEALYQQALIQYKLKELKAAEDKLLKLIQAHASYDKWVTKSFILLADIYTDYGQLYQAKQTLQSVIDYQEDSILVKIAIEKKLAIEQLEAQQADSTQINDSL